MKDLWLLGHPGVAGMKQINTTNSQNMCASLRLDRLGMLID